MKEEYYSAEISEIFKKFETSFGGISFKEAEKRLKKYGPNEIIIKERPFFVKIILYFILSFKNPFSYLLLVAVLISFFTGRSIDALLIFLILTFNGILETYYQIKGEKSVKNLKKMDIDKILVKRGNSVFETDSRYIVPGDIIILKEGEKIPADARIIFAKDFSVNEAILTGESSPVEKVETPLKGKLEIHEMKNLVFKGTIVVRGKAEAVVLKTGENTYYGKIVKFAKKEKKETSDIEVFLKNIVKITASISILTAFFVFIFLLKKEQDIVNLFIFSISLLVASIPEGLPLALGLGISMAINRLSKKKVITKNPSAISYLPYIDVICTDKTGTITENKMKVVKLMIGKREIVFKNNKFYYKNTILYPPDDRFLEKFLEIAILNSEANYVMEGDKINLFGSPTEKALLKLGIDANIDINYLRLSFKKIDEIPFSSQRKYSATLYSQNVLNNNKIKTYQIFLTGAPEILLEKSEKFVYKSKILSFKNFKEKGQELLHKIKELEKNYRVIGFAYKITRKKIKNLDEKDLKNLVFLGVALIEDPPRKGVKNAVLELKSRGIELKMITGDALNTSVNIAKRVKILEDKYDLAITGKDFLKIKGKKLLKLINRIKVFARALPEVKLKIIKVLRKRGNKILMTGDGVNDTPALTNADVSFSMGEAGSDAAREVSDFVLVDDNFVNIKNAIDEARKYHQNFKKILIFLFTTNIGEVLGIIYFVLTKSMMILSPTQILWINFVTDGIALYGLFKEPLEKAQKIKTPEYYKTGIFKIKDYVYIVGLSFYLLLSSIFLYNYFYEKNQELFFALVFENFILIQVFNLFNVKSLEDRFFNKNFFKNKIFFVIFLISIFLGIFVVLNEKLAYYFKISPLEFKNLLIIFLIGVIFVLYGQAFKFIINKIFKK